MKTTFRINNPDDLMASITITGTVKQLRELNEQLADKWPSWKVSSAITDVVFQAQKTFYADVGESQE